MAASGAEMMVRALCSMMGIDMAKMGPQVIGTMNNVKLIQEQIASIEQMCKNNAAALARIEAVTGTSPVTGSEASLTQQELLGHDFAGHGPYVHGSGIGRTD